MPLLDAIRMALTTLWSQKLKSFFSLIGVLIGVTFLIAVVSIVQGMNVYMRNSFANAIVGVNSFNLVKHQDGSFSTPRSVRLKWERRAPIRSEDADFLQTRVKTPALFAKACDGGISLRFGGKLATSIGLVGTEEPYFQIKRYALLHGRPFSTQEVRAGAPVVVIGAEIANKLLQGLDPLGQQIRIADLPFRVVGVVEPQGTLFGMSLDKFAIVPISSAAKRLMCPTNELARFMIQPIDPNSLKPAIDEVEALMRSHRGLRPAVEDDFYIETAEGALETWEKISQILFLALPGLVAISLVVGGIVIMNIMLMAVSERTREIGVRKALGAKRRDILAQFVVEAATLSSVGALFGILTGIGLAFVIKAVSPLPAAVAPWSIIVAVVLGISVGMVAGIYPASRASRLDPIDALRAE